MSRRTLRSRRGSRTAQNTRNVQFVLLLFVRGSLEAPSLHLITSTCITSANYVGLLVQTNTRPAGDPSPLAMFSSLLGGSNSATASGSTSSSSSSGPATATSVAQVRAPKERLANPESAFGPLTQQDTSWLCAGGFTTETQTFYAMSGGKSPKFIMVQVIHSAVG